MLHSARDMCVLKCSTRHQICINRARFCHLAQWQTPITNTKIPWIDDHDVSQQHTAQSSDRCLLPRQDQRHGALSCWGVIPAPAQIPLWSLELWSLFWSAWVSKRSHHLPRFTDQDKPTIAWWPAHSCAHGPQSHQNRDGHSAMINAGGSVCFGLVERCQVSRGRWRMSAGRCRVSGQENKALPVNPRTGDWEPLMGQGNSLTVACRHYNRKGTVKWGISCKTAEPVVFTCLRKQLKYRNLQARPIWYGLLMFTGIFPS